MTHVGHRHTLLVRGWVVTYKLHTSQPQHKKKFCNQKCNIQYQYEERIRLWKQTGTADTKDGCSVWIKRYILEKQNNSCKECGISEWNSKPIVLELEHIDGNSNNNIEQNLCCLCPNCHSQTNTYKGRNKGSGRHSRRDRYKEGKSF